MYINFIPTYKTAVILLAQNSLSFLKRFFIMHIKRSGEPRACTQEETATLLRKSKHHKIKQAKPLASNIETHYFQQVHSTYITLTNLTGLGNKPSPKEVADSTEVAYASVTKVALPPSMRIQVTTFQLLKESCSSNGHCTHCSLTFFSSLLL